MEEMVSKCYLFGIREAPVKNGGENAVTTRQKQDMDVCFCAARVGYNPVQKAKDSDANVKVRSVIGPEPRNEYHVYKLPSSRQVWFSAGRRMTIMPSDCGERMASTMNSSTPPGLMGV